MDELIRLDQQLLLALNGSDSQWLDNCFLMITQTGTWIPLILVLLYVLLKNRPWREVLLFVACLALVIFVADRFSSGFCKPFFHRFRPSHEPALEGLVDLVGDRRGGLYGFISSHAANTFGAWAFVSLYFRRRLVSLTVLLWACCSSYSRIYLGLHYPGDILFGALWGLTSGVGCYFLMCLVARQSPFVRTLKGYRPNPYGLSPEPLRVPVPTLKGSTNTLLGRRCNPEGFGHRDEVLLAITLLLTLLFVGLYALL